MNSDYPVNIIKNSRPADRPFIKKALAYHKKLKGAKCYLSLDSIGIPKDIEEAISKKIVVPGYYGRLAPSAGNLAWSIYKMMLREKTIKRHYLLEKNKHQILKKYKNLLSNDKILPIEALTNEYDLPPSNIYKVILKSFYHFNPMEIKAIMINPSGKIPKKIIEEIEWINKNDVIAGVDQSIAQERADEYEVSIKKILDASNVKYLSQEELIEDQKNNGTGSLIATPDFLLKTPLYINNKPIAWIDAKHSYGMDIPIIKSSLEKQTKKYTEIWGYGALCFSAGFSESLEIPGVLLLATPHGGAARSPKTP